MDLILKYFPDLTEEQKRQFAALYDLYLDWNSKINVISRKDSPQKYSEANRTYYWLSTYVRNDGAVRQYLH